MATHSGTLAWRIPRTEELGRRQSMAHTEVGVMERLSMHIQPLPSLPVLLQQPPVHLWSAPEGVS